MKFSIITAVLNNVDTIEACIKSVASQTYSDKEHIIIDGGSTDGSLDVIERYRDNIAKLVSEPDNGIYDALNKGIRSATGELIGILHADDFFADESVISDVVQLIGKKDIDACYGDIVYVDRYNVDRVVRVWKAGEYKRERFKYGWMPPHTAFFCKSGVYRRLGLLDLDFPLAADYELMLRFLYKHKIRVEYLNRTVVKMRTGGTSRPGTYTLKAVFENYRAWKKNGLSYPLTMLFKPFSKMSQFFIRD
ncbi:MAG: glycosyltransferase family 2 protein [Bacteroidales bacterium]